MNVQTIRHRFCPLRWPASAVLICLVLIPPLLFADTVKQGTAESLMQQGAQAYQRGAFEEALNNWRAAASRYHETGSTDGESRALVSAAQATQALGQSTQAIQYLELALALAQKGSDHAWHATVLDQIGRAYLTARQLDPAAQYLAQAEEVARRQPSAAVSAAILNDLGVLHALKREDKEALEAFTDCVAVSREAGLQMLAVNSRVNAARISLRLGNPNASRQWLDEALDQLKDLPVSRDKAVGFVNIGLVYESLLPALPEIRKPLLLRSAGALQEAIGISEQLKDSRTLSYALGYMGHLYELEARTEDALLLTRRAIFAAQSVDAPESLYRWQWQLARLLASMDQIDESLAAYRQAAATLQPIRFEVSQAAAEASLSNQESIKPLFFEFADLLLQRASRTEDQKIAEGYLLAARDAVEAFKAAELRDYFKDGCVDAIRSRLTTFDRLSPDTAVIYPILFPKRIELLVTLPSGFYRTAVPIAIETVTQEVRDFRRRVEKRTTREYLPHAKQLYDWLIRPIEGQLKQEHITTLVVVPDGVLRTIPMAALHDGESFVIQKFAVAITPGITLTDPKPLNREKVRFLATGLTKSVQGFPALPYVAEEVDSIHNLYGGDQLLDQDFLAPRLEQELREGRYGILHIATHGKFSTDVNDSFLLTFDGKLTMSKLDQLIGLFRFREDPLELLALSACQTGVGDDRAALGLAGVAIKAGARSALATLWFINDEASSALISEFYRQLRNPSVSKAVAMQRAQIKLLGDRVYQHPAYWSPFLLLNNWL
ncbi:CHAT domain-containing protein [Nitrospira japonica]|uniref:CHAT domain-containing protein n=1 Tax=Nitrospira japonica TaxID=1325564 RepID=UPI0009B949A9|nr:CHAT domain-containing protein [Nitrospira japonica]